MASTLNICIALEYPFTSNRITARKWMLFQPDKNPEGSLDKMREDGMKDDSILTKYNRILQNGTQTPEVMCKQVIYLKLDRGHYTSYLYKGEFEPGKDTEAERLRLDADQKLAERLKREDEDAQRESEGVSDPWDLGFSETELEEQRKAFAELEAAKMAMQRFGTPHLRRNRAFVSHVLKAARSSHLRY